MRITLTTTEAPPPAMVAMSCPTFGADEEAAALAVLSAQPTHGEHVEVFESAFALAIGARFAVATSSPTAALFLALKGHGIGAGDEVITSPLTSAATIAAIERTGAGTVFADVDETLVLAPAAVAAAIGSRTRAIVPVHLHGNPCNLPALSQLAEAHGLTIVQDAWQAMGATVGGQPLGAFGTATFSLDSSGLISTGKGGMVVTNDPDVADFCAQQGRATHRSMTDVQAAIGLVQLSKLDAIVARRRMIASWYDQTIAADCLPRPWVLAGTRPAYCHYTLRVPEGPHARDGLRSALWRRGVATAVYYPIPLNLLVGATGIWPLEPVRCPIAERAASDMLSIPVHQGLTDAEVEYVGAVIVDLIRWTGSVQPGHDDGVTFSWTGQPEADRLLETDPLALLIGLVLDQQVKMEKAFIGPYELKKRLGHLDARKIAKMPPDRLDAVFRERPALHRFPGSMASRVQQLCQVVTAEYKGDAGAVWRDVSTGAELAKRISSLPGFGEQKTKITVAVLAKKLGVRPQGWEEEAAHWHSVADVDSPETMEEAREVKRRMKAEAKA
jgi:uncharacterized HhH-GPD family protein